jgi:hypothetical protein
MKENNPTKNKHIYPQNKRITNRYSINQRDKEGILQDHDVHRLGKRVFGGSWTVCKAETESLQHCKTKRTWSDPPLPGLLLWIFSSFPSLITVS